jgi:aquaporin Z
VSTHPAGTPPDGDRIQRNCPRAGIRQGYVCSVTSVRRYVAEFVGTLLLVFFGVGSAVAARVEGGVVVVAMTFGVTLLALVYTIGPLSGCHVNPAVTLGVLIARKISLVGAIDYWLAQFGGAIVAAFGLWILTRWGGVRDQTGNLGSNGYGVHINLGGTFLLEIALTFLLVLIVLVVTSRSEHAGFAGLAIGFALMAANLVGIALDGASVNPARSLGPAVFEGGEALRQLWVFIVAPLAGGALAALLAPTLVSLHGRYGSDAESAE